ncbi:hypothetical protein Y1Q_0022719 [Alligator mississippiensis]|uniref:Uncharacterized protein n=1 Tax=Alligator mississippiensis TaxID=8496 RepID=A0A151MYA7_ALLMI|nr:hypothetical protein Y1Q_0022719 [Alligator mississippiensis]
MKGLGKQQFLAPWYTTGDREEWQGRPAQRKEMEEKLLNGEMPELGSVSEDITMVRSTHKDVRKEKVLSSP